MAETEDDAEPNVSEFVTYRIARAHQRLNSQATRLLERHSGLTLTQWRIIVTMAADNLDTLSGIADRTLIDKGLLSRNLSALIRDGLVVSNSDQSDRRINRIALSPDGVAAHDMMLPIMRERQRRLERNLSPEERRIIRDGLEKLEEAVKQADEGG